MTPMEHLSSRLHAEMVQGEMHPTLRDIGCWAGGLEATGSLSSLEIAELKELGCSLSNNKILAAKTWDNGYVYGKARPIEWGAPHLNDRVLNWESSIGGRKSSQPESYPVFDERTVQPIETVEPEEWSPGRQVTEYLNLLFQPPEHVGLSMKSWKREGYDKWLPTEGVYHLTAGEILARVEKYGDDLGAAVEDYSEEAGAWVRVNPLDGQGVKDKNVTEYRHVLVESDTVPIDEQHAIYRELELPIVALVHSGNKSLHAIVRVGADTLDEYYHRVNLVYEVCEKHGLKVDRQNRNPSRLSRLPGITRNGQKQYIVATNIGKPNWDEWEEFITGTHDSLPDVECLHDVWGKLPPLSDELIAGVLRKGHKLLLSGASKGGKSFSLIELCIAIAEGGEWFGLQCLQGEVLYVNLELDRPSCLHRFEDVYAAEGIPPTSLKNINIWNLRGHAIPMDRLVPKLIHRAKKKQYSAIVIDPIYKVITGDENSAEKMAYFCNQFDRVCNELGVAVIYCHHHSKGSQGQKRSMDRASGSGVFGRDPDAVLDMIELIVADKYKLKHTDTGWRIEGTLREFERLSPINFWFRYPIHTVDAVDGVLATARPETDQTFSGSRAANDAKDQRHAKQRVQLQSAFNECAEADGTASVNDVMRVAKIGKSTLRDRVNMFKAEGWVMDKGRVWKLLPEEEGNEF